MYSLTMARAHPYRGFFWQSVLISVVALAHHHSHFAPTGIRTMVCLQHTPHSQLIAVPVRLTNYVGRADGPQDLVTPVCDAPWLRNQLSFDHHTECNEAKPRKWKVTL